MSIARSALTSALGVSVDDDPVVDRRGVAGVVDHRVELGRILLDDLELVARELGDALVAFASEDEECGATGQGEDQNEEQDRLELHVLMRLLGVRRA